MVDRITMNKGVTLGYGNLDNLELVGRAFGYDIYIDKEEKTVSISKGLTLKLFMRWWAAGAPKLGTWIGPDSHTMKERVESVKYIGIDVKQPWTIIALLPYRQQKNVK